jgi:IPT/TIG domain
MITRSCVLRLLSLLFSLFVFTTVANAQTPTITGISPDGEFSGQPTPVSITGTNLGSSGTVTFNGVTASIAGWSSTSIAAYIPAQAEQVPVVVTTTAGSSNGFLYNENLTPSLATPFAYFWCGWKYADHLRPQSGSLWNSLHDGRGTSHTR